MCQTKWRKLSVWAGEQAYDTVPKPLQRLDEEGPLPAQVWAADSHSGAAHSTSSVRGNLTESSSRRAARPASRRERER